MTVAAPVSPHARCSTVADCDAALRLLRRLRREGAVEERALAQLAIDDVLDRRLELMRERDDG